VTAGTKEGAGNDEEANAEDDDNDGAAWPSLLIAGTGSGNDGFADVGLRTASAFKVGDEFNTQFIIKTGGDDYQRIDEIKATGASLIVPVNYPTAYEVEDAWDADNVALSELKHWEMAPMNAGMLAKAGIPFALTSAGLRNRTEFMANVRKAIENGLTEQQALEALTTTPARLMRAEDMVGTLQVGKIANFLITSGSLFAADNVLYENWIRGKQYVVTNRNQPESLTQTIMSV